MVPCCCPEEAPVPRVAVLGLTLEANTFSTVKATMEGMQREGGVHRGAAIADHYLGSTATLAGFLDPDVPDGVELVPLVSYRAGALGQFTADAFDDATADMAAELRARGPFDAVLLALHGAAVAENAEHADAQAAERMRAVVGPDVPIGVVLDMHANVDRQLVDCVDVLRIFQTNPHVDPRDRALECRSVVLSMLEGRPRPVVAFEQLPLVVNIVKQDTSDEPMAGILARARELEERPGMLDVTIAEGFPYADVEQMGMAVLASHRDDRAAAQAAVDEIAALLWDARVELQGGAVTIDEALQRVSSHTGDRPILLLDVGDNVGGGSCGDSTSILNAAVDQGVGRIAMTLWDPSVVAELSDVAVGEPVSVMVGGRSAEQEGRPQPLRAVLTGRSDGVFEDPGPTHGGFRRYDAGPSVALRTDSGIAVVVTTHPMGNTSAELLRMVGVEPGEFAAVVGKGVNSPKAGYGRVCGEQLMVDTPGVTRLSVEAFDYTRRRRPMYPFEPQTQYAVAAAAR
jgi:microcystin degradation protein MlrC